MYHALEHVYMHHFSQHVYRLAYWLHILIVACASYADPKLSKIYFGTSLLRCTHCAGWMWRDKMSAMYGKDMKT